MTKLTRKNVDITKSMPLLKKIVKFHIRKVNLLIPTLKKVKFQDWLFPIMDQKTNFFIILILWSNISRYLIKEYF